MRFLAALSGTATIRCVPAQASVTKTKRHALQQMLENGSARSRVRGGHSVDRGEAALRAQSPTKFLVEGSRLGIPAMSHEECLVGLMARCHALPVAAGLPAQRGIQRLIERVGKSSATRAGHPGCHQGLAPVLDVSRDVRWGPYRGNLRRTASRPDWRHGDQARCRGLAGSTRPSARRCKHRRPRSAKGAQPCAVHLGCRSTTPSWRPICRRMAVILRNCRFGDAGHHAHRQRTVPPSHHLLTTVSASRGGTVLESSPTTSVSASCIQITTVSPQGVNRGACRMTTPASTSSQCRATTARPRSRRPSRRGLLSVEDRRDRHPRAAEKFRVGSSKPYADEGAVCCARRKRSKRRARSRIFRGRSSYWN